MTDKDWEELEHGPFIYSYDDEYYYECTRCKKTWDEFEETKCVCLDGNDNDNDYDDELISFENHEEIIINLDNEDKIKKIKFKNKNIKNKQ